MITMYKYVDKCVYIYIYIHTSTLMIIYGSSLMTDAWSLWWWWCWCWWRTRFQQKYCCILPYLIVDSLSNMFLLFERGNHPICSICSMVLVHFPTFAQTKSLSLVGCYIPTPFCSHTGMDTYNVGPPKRFKLAYNPIKVWLCAYHEPELLQLCSPTELVTLFFPHKKRTVCLQRGKCTWKIQVADGFPEPHETRFCRCSDLAA